MPKLYADLTFDPAQFSQRRTDRFEITTPCLAGCYFLLVWDYDEGEPQSYSHPGVPGRYYVSDGCPDPVHHEIAETGRAYDDYEIVIMQAEHTASVIDDVVWACKRDARGAVPRGWDYADTSTDNGSTDDDLEAMPF